MIDTEVAERIDRDTVRMQWRGSDDGIVWSPWSVLAQLHQKIPFHKFVQGRIWVDGEWFTSPVDTYPEDWA